MTTTVHGHCDDRFSAVRDAFQANFDNGLEDGASVAILVDGSLVVAAAARPPFPPSRVSVGRRRRQRHRVTASLRFSRPV